jgi:hydroxymethylbilane synthase
VSTEKVRIGTRGSALALWQARWVAERLRAELPDCEMELVPVTTRGDVHEGPLEGGPGEIGFFTSEIEAALLEGRVDIAVHSLKDLPTAESERLPVASIPLRHDPADVLVARDGLGLAALPEGARIGTSSPRRTCLVRSKRPDARVVPVRGNVDTRVGKIHAGEYDAIVLAAAGLARLGLEGAVTERFDPTLFPPAPGQGALAVQARTDGPEAMREALVRIDDADARRTAEAERACLAALGGGCARPIGAHAVVTAAGLELFAFVGSEDGGRILRAHGVGGDPAVVGRGVAEELISLGAAELLAG